MISNAPSAWVPAMMMHLFYAPRVPLKSGVARKLFSWGHKGRDSGFRYFSSLRRNGDGSAKASNSVPYIEIQDVTSEGWKLSPAIEILKQGGLGIIPTDTCYMFVTSVHSRTGVERIYALKNSDPKLKKPLSLLCNSISQISTYTTAMNSRRVFKLVKELLPGPYTFIFPASSDLPRMILEHKGHLKTWKRREIGIRMPDNEVCLHVMEGVGEPLLCASVGLRDEAGDPVTDPARLHETLRGRVDFAVDGGPEAGRVSTVVDLTDPDRPAVLRAGAGDTAPFERA